MCERRCDDPFCYALGSSEYDLRTDACRAEDLLRDVDLGECRERLDPTRYDERRLLLACEVVSALASYDRSLVPAVSPAGEYTHYRGLVAGNGGETW